nr:hypothetical protein Q903MT_gene2772 [Picea sitchensis]
MEGSLMSAIPWVSDYSSGRGLACMEWAVGMALRKALHLAL